MHIDIPGTVCIHTTALKGLLPAMTKAHFILFALFLQEFLVPLLQCPFIPLYHQEEHTLRDQAEVWGGHQWNPAHQLGDLQDVPRCKTGYRQDPVSRSFWWYPRQSRAVIGTGITIIKHGIIAKSGFLQCFTSPGAKAVMPFCKIPLEKPGQRFHFQLCLQKHIYLHFRRGYTYWTSWL